MVRIHASHAWYTGSIPVGATKQAVSTLSDTAFFIMFGMRVVWRV